LFNLVNRLNILNLLLLATRSHRSLDDKADIKADGIDSLPCSTPFEATGPGRAKPAIAGAGKEAVSPRRSRRTRRMRGRALFLPKIVLPAASPSAMDSFDNLQHTTYNFFHHTTLRQRIVCMNSAQPKSCKHLFLALFTLWSL